MVKNKLWAEKFLENSQNFFKKTIDKLNLLLYNIVTVKRRRKKGWFKWQEILRGKVNRII